MQLECTNFEQNIKKGIKTNNKTYLSRFMQRNEWDTADVTDPVFTLNYDKCKRLLTVFQPGSSKEVLHQKN